MSHQRIIRNHVSINYGYDDDDPLLKVFPKADVFGIIDNIHATSESSYGPAPSRVLGKLLSCRKYNARNFEYMLGPSGNCHLPYLFLDSALRIR